MLRVFSTDKGKDLLLVGVAWRWLQQAPRGTVVIDPTTSVATSQDVWLENSGNKSSYDILLIGKAAGYPKKRTVIQFNISGSGIPTSATVLNARMKLKYYTAVRVGSTAWVDRWVQAHQLLVSWTEAQATRDDRLTGVPWGAPYGAIDGTDAKADYESTVLFQQDYPRWKAWDLTELTQKWVDGSATNYGVILWATNEDTDGYDLRLYSSEASQDSVRPYLEVVWSDSAKTVYFLKDHLGSIRASVDETGEVQGYDDFDPWGYILADRSVATPWSALQGTAKNKFTGKIWDDDYGLNWYYFGARYLDPEVGRWVSVDPLAEKYPGWSPYTYAFDNPLKFKDNDGQAPVIVIGALALGTGELAVAGLVGIAALAVAVNADETAEALKGTATFIDENVNKPLYGVIESGVEGTKGLFDSLVNVLTKSNIRSKKNQPNTKAGGEQAKNQEEKAKLKAKDQDRQSTEFNRENRKVDPKRDVEKFQEDIQKLSPKSQRKKDLIDAIIKALAQMRKTQ